MGRGKAGSEELPNKPLGEMGPLTQGHSQAEGGTGGAANNHALCPIALTTHLSPSLTLPQKSHKKLGKTEGHTKENLKSSLSNKEG